MNRYIYLIYNVLQSWQLEEANEKSLRELSSRKEAFNEVEQEKQRLFQEAAQVSQNKRIKSTCAFYYASPLVKRGRCIVLLVAS